MEVLHLLFGIFGKATSLFLFLVPILTFRRIIKNKSTGDFSVIPYVMTLLNCLLSSWYCLPFVSPNNIMLSTINGAGIIIESIYVLIFLIYAPKNMKVKILGLLTLVLTLFSVIALVSIYAFDGNMRKLVCGLAGIFFSILMYASPLSVMRLVIRSKSVEFMPFFLSLFFFLRATSWFIYGLLGHDPFILVANAFGCALGSLLLVLYAIYRSNKGDEAKATIATTTTTDDTIELGFGKTLQKKQLTYAQPSLDTHV